MTDIAGITTTADTTTTSTTAESGNTLGMDEFLTLLVAQLQYQDPLNPSDPTEFTSQLAQYSELEQLFNLNDAMDELTTAQNTSQQISSLSLIGKDILVEGDSFSYSGEPVDLGYKIEGTVDSATIYIQDSTGQTVDTIEIDDTSEGNHTFSWTGLDSEGNPLESGTYSISVVTGEESSEDAVVTPLMKTEVTGVDLEGSEPMLTTSFGNFTIDSIHGAYDQEAKDSGEEEDNTTEG
ncbi:MAG: flagellar hook capping protein [Desulfobulbus propionicus]|nr:MAG: flagellar hook capping protein [Desulfobulbus propionicus]